MDKKKLSKWLDWFIGTDSMVYPVFGMIIILLGLTGTTGGGLGVRATAESEIRWIVLSGLPAWVSWLFVWYGFDIAIFRGRATGFIVDKVSKPIMKAIKGEKLGDTEDADSK